MSTKINDFFNFAYLLLILIINLITIAIASTSHASTPFVLEYWDFFIQFLNYAKIKPMEYRFFDLLCFSGDPRVLDTLIQIVNYAKIKPMEYRFFDLLCFS